MRRRLFPARPWRVMGAGPGPRHDDAVRAAAQALHPAGSGLLSRAEAERLLDDDALDFGRRQARPELATVSTGELPVIREGLE